MRVRGRLGTPRVEPRTVLGTGLERRVGERLGDEARLEVARGLASQQLGERRSREWRGTDAGLDLRQLATIGRDRVEVRRPDARGRQGRIADQRDPRSRDRSEGAHRIGVVMRIAVERDGEERELSQRREDLGRVGRAHACDCVAQRKRFPHGSGSIPWRDAGRIARAQSEEGRGLALLIASGAPASARVPAPGFVHNSSSVPLAST